MFGCPFKTCLNVSSIVDIMGNFKWDIRPTNNNVVNNITRTKLTVVEDGEKEKGIPDDALLDAEYNSDNDDGNPEEPPPKKKIEDEFCSLERETLATIKKYIMRWGTNKDEFVEWSILQDGVFFH
jgi:hypothetical protein